MKDKFPLISIAMLNFNGLKYLKETIPPILSLNYPNFEFIIVDNGSSDGSIEFISLLKKVKLVQNKENFGYSKGKNIAFNNANGEYVLSIDNDILLRDKDILNLLLASYKKDTGFLQIPFIDIGKNKASQYGIFVSFYGINSHKPNILIENIIQSKTLIPIVGPMGGVMFIEKSKWKNLQGFDESQKFNLDDMDIGPRSCIYGYKNYLLNKYYAIHLGIKKTISKEVYANRFKFLFSGHARGMIKNYRSKNLLWAFPIFFLFQFLKTIKYSFTEKNFMISVAFFQSIKLFFENLQDTLRQRKIVQSKRVIKEDIFFNIRPPKFN